MSGSKRIEWIDVAKGVGIVLVSFGHLRNGDGESVWLPALDVPIDAIYLFHMPLFFLLGGAHVQQEGRVQGVLGAQGQDVAGAVLRVLPVLPRETVRDTAHTIHARGLPDEPRLRYCAPVPRRARHGQRTVVPHGVLRG